MGVGETRKFALFPPPHTHTHTQMGARTFYCVTTLAVVVFVTLAGLTTVADANTSEPDFDMTRCLSYTSVLFNRTACTVCKIATADVRCDDTDCEPQSTSDRCKTCDVMKRNRATAAFFAARAYCRQLTTLLTATAALQDSLGQTIIESPICELDSCKGNGFPEDTMDPHGLAKDCTEGLQEICPSLSPEKGPPV